MITAPRASHPPARARPSRGASGANIPYGLYCLAGAFNAESDARDTLLLLTEAHGLSPEQVTLLAPVDASWRQFKNHSRQWMVHTGSSRHLGGLWTLVLMGGLITGLLTACGLVLDDSLSAQAEIVTTALAAAAGAVLAFVAIYAARPQLDRRYRTFCREVKRQLRARRWILLVHDVPALRQDAVVSLVRHCSTKWCAVSAEQRWL